MIIYGASFLYRPLTNEEVVGEPLIRSSLITTKITSDFFAQGIYGEVLAIGDACGKNHSGEVVWRVPEVGNIVKLDYGLLLDDGSVGWELFQAAVNPIRVRENSYDFRNGLILQFSKIKLEFTKSEWEEYKKVAIETEHRRRAYGESNSDEFTLNQGKNIFIPLG